MSSRGLSTSAAQHVSIFSRGFHIDWVLLFASAMTALIGILTIHSTELGNNTGYMVRQSVATLIGSMMLLVLTVIPYQVFRAYTRPLYVVLILMLLSVFVLGSNLRGTR